MIGPFFLFFAFVRGLAVCWPPAFLYGPFFFSALQDGSTAGKAFFGDRGVRRGGSSCKLFLGFFLFLPV